MGRTEEALSELLKVLERAPDHPEAHVLLSRALRSARGQLGAVPGENVVSALEKALERAPKSRWCKNSLTQALLLRVAVEVKDLARAASLLLEALEEGDIHLQEGTVLSQTLTDISRMLAERGSSMEVMLDWLKAPPSYAATDAICSAAWRAEGLSEVPELLRQAARDSESTGRLQYLVARLAEISGDLNAAARKLAEVVTAHSMSIEPRLRLAEVLRAASQSSQAEEVLRAGLLAGARADPKQVVDRRLSDQWLKILFVDLKRTPAEALAALPQGAPEDVRWLLDQLAAGEAVRIDCGAEEDYRDVAGNVWGKDRFAFGGEIAKLDALEIDGTANDPLYQTERWFPLPETGGLSSYLLPLPPGRYQVRLHFAEVWWRIPGFRRFDVILQGERVLVSFDLVREAGFAHAIVREFETTVTNGSLEIRLERPHHQFFVVEPKLSAIEVERLH